MKDPGTVSDLVLEMESLLVRGFGLPHFPKDFEPAVGETAQGVGVRTACLAFCFVIALSPRALGAAGVGPKMESGTEGGLAVMAKLDLLKLAALLGHGSGASMALESLGIWETGAFGTEFGEEAWSELFAGARQRAKEVVIRMLGKELGDARAVDLELCLESLEHLYETEREEAFGGAGRRGAAKFRGFGENIETCLDGIRSPELVLVEELFPLAYASLLQSGWGGKGFDKSPGKGLGEIIEGLEGRWIILEQSLEELVNEGGALLDEADFVSAQKAQFTGEGIIRQEAAPKVSVGAQGIGHGPGIALIIAGAAGSFALAKAHGHFWVDGINGDVAGQKLFDGGSLAGFDGDG